ncbi:LysE family translocator [Pseudomonas aeruginosa]|uniref:LysE family translocator n=1 Tax=Pseudomonas aeruginosa TaxID=287 RepID=UPI00053E8119|nr:LysE family translocator [Pseudomonas aeruginosa]MBH8910419.1 LysE family translocator [Pseudomonas aeruginosa]MBI8706948.1 LysE family translocator [Pseudomonas aeruginosa]
MQQFLMIVAAHFLALLSPGPDFFLIARTSISSGWRVASGACLGIALANGTFIVAAFAGFSVLYPGSLPFVTLQLAGCLYLLYLGWLFIRHAGSSPLHAMPAATVQRPAIPATASWFRSMGMGFLSGILNPKNALFYASLAAMLTGTQASTGWKIVYGTWMFGVVLLWDLLVAVLIGNQAVLRRFARALPWLERISGAVLILLALGVIAALVLDAG